MQQSSKLLWVPITFFFWPPIGKCGCIKYATQFTCSQDQHDVSPLETQLTICIPYLKSSDIAWSAGSAFCPWCHLDSYHLVNRNKMWSGLRTLCRILRRNLRSKKYWEWLVMYEIPKVYKHWWTWQRASLVTLTFGLQSFPSSLTVMLHFISCALFWPSEFGSRIYWYATFCCQICSLDNQLQRGGHT